MIVSALTFDVYDTLLASVRTVRVATIGFVTRPGETPANTYFDERLTQPAAVTRDAFDTGTTGGRSRAGYGNAVIANGDGALDYLKDCAIDGRAVTQLSGTFGAAYPGGLTPTFVGTAEQMLFGSDTITIVLRDRQAELDTPFQPNKYAGSNALPAGLEGIATDLKGKPKPICRGAVLNVPAICVNTAKLIYQVHDGAVLSIPAVYDKGIALGVANAWHTRSSGFGASDVYSACYGGGQYLIGGASGKLATSPTGVTWTLRASAAAVFSGPFDAITSIAFGNSIYVAVGSSGLCASSPDGITWTSRSISFAGQPANQVKWISALSLFVIVGLGGKLATSPDGITWTLQASAAVEFSSLAINSVVYANGLLVAVGAYGIGTSPDGVTWTHRLATLVGCVWIDYGNGIFVATGNGYTATSLDGLNWTQLLGGFGPIYFNGREFIASEATASYSTSLDGITWVTRVNAALFGSASIFAFTFGANGYVLVGSGGLVASTGNDDYANTTDLLDDTLAPVAGEFRACPSAAYFRLGSPPDGTVTADVLEGATAADRTVGQIFAREMTRAGVSYSAADITALDTYNSAVAGFFEDEESSYAEQLDALANSIGAWWGPDVSGVFRIQPFTAPSGTPVLDLTANDLIGPPERLAPNDASKGIPRTTSIVRYAHNYTVQTTDVAGGVTDARRAEIGTEWREAISDDPTVLVAHLLAKQVTEETLLSTEAAALTEAARRQALYGVSRDRYRLTVQMTPALEAIDLFPVIRLAYPRYGMTAGVLLRVIGVAPDHRLQRVTLTTWR